MRVLLCLIMIVASIIPHNRNSMCVVCCVGVCFLDGDGAIVPPMVVLLCEGDSRSRLMMSGVIEQSGFSLMSSHMGLLVPSPSMSLSHISGVPS